MKKRIVRNLSLVAALSISTTMNAQLPDGGIYPDGHIVTDLEGNTHDIDAILASGQAVIIDAFADWCPPCWYYHVEGVLEDLHEDLPYVNVFGLEADPSVPESFITNPGTGMGDWSLGGTVGYVLADDNEVAGNLNLAYYPTIVLVCPDHTTTEIGQQSYAYWKNAILNCPGLATSITETDAISVTSIYPNPATDMANISFSVKDAGVAKIEILNAVGQVIVSQDLGTVSGQQNIVMNTADLASGIYIVRISVGENITTRSLSISAN